MCYLEIKVTIRKERILIDKEILFTRLIHPFPFPQSSYPSYLFTFIIQL
jgi:hypothetical protein